MKNLARSCFCWSNVDKFVEDFVNSCEQCLINDMLPGTPAYLWESTKSPWVRTTVGFVGSFLVKMFILITIPFQSGLKFLLLKHRIQKGLLDTQENVL